MTNWSDFQALLQAIAPAREEILAARRMYPAIHIDHQDYWWSEQVAKIAAEFSLTVEQIVEYDERLDQDSEDAITVFYYEDKWLAGEPCFDVRYGSQKLPKGVCPIGYITRKGALVKSIATFAAQLQQLKSIVASALISVGAWDADFEALLKDGVIKF